MAWLISTSRSKKYFSESSLISVVGDVLKILISPLQAEYWPEYDLYNTATTTFTATQVLSL